MEKNRKWNNLSRIDKFWLLLLSRVRSKEKLVTRRRTFESEAVSKKDREDANLLLEERLNEEEEMSKIDEHSAEKDVPDSHLNNVAEEDDDACMPAPQVRLGPDGQIIIDDRSLVRPFLKSPRLSKFIYLKLCVIF